MKEKGGNSEGEKRSCTCPCLQLVSAAASSWSSSRFSRAARNSRPFYLQRKQVGRGIDGKLRPSEAGKIDE